MPIMITVVIENTHTHTNPLSPVMAIVFMGLIFPNEVTEILKGN